MKRFAILSLMAIACLTMQAQTSRQIVRFLAKCDAYYLRPCPEPVVDKNTKKKTAVWPDTENNSWHENIGFVKDVPTVNNLEFIFPDFHASESFNISGRQESYMPVLWLLAEENDETVLHCYFRMPADIVENFWLCSDECVILDKASGTIYRSRRAVPNCYGKVFSFKGKEGTMLDFQIFFPKLPESVKEIAIYGVPNWYMRGMDVSLVSQSGHFWEDYRGIDSYDSIPQFHKPHLVTEAKDYNKDDHKTWAVYDDAHLIKPTKDGTYALWLTPEATYLAEACEMNWMREYFGRGGNEMLINQFGHQYKCKSVLDYPNDSLFWNEGVTGDYFAIVRVFDPLPMETEAITLVVPEGEPFAMWGASWSGKVVSLNIKELRENQKLFEYHPRKVVE